MDPSQDWYPVVSTYCNSEQTKTNPRQNTVTSWIGLWWLKKFPELQEIDFFESPGIWRRCSRKQMSAKWPCLPIPVIFMCSRSTHEIMIHLLKCGWWTCQDFLGINSSCGMDQNFNAKTSFMSLGCYKVEKVLVWELYSFIPLVMLFKLINCDHQLLWPVWLVCLLSQSYLVTWTSWPRYFHYLIRLTCVSKGPSCFFCGKEKYVNCFSAGFILNLLGPYWFHIFVVFRKVWAS